MATHNIEDGTGGLDAFIRFEKDRLEVIFLSKHLVKASLSKSFAEYRRGF
jgi:hypothetical protein